jgi:hypothetical protein
MSRSTRTYSRSERRKTGRLGFTTPTVATPIPSRAFLFLFPLPMANLLRRPRRDQAIGFNEALRRCPCGRGAPVPSQGQGVAGHSVPIFAQAPHFPSQQYSPALHDFEPHDAILPSPPVETEASSPPPSESELGGVIDETPEEDWSVPPQAPSISTNENPQTTVRIMTSVKVAPSGHSMPGEPSNSCALRTAGTHSVRSGLCGDGKTSAGAPLLTRRLGGSIGLPLLRAFHPGEL